MDVPQFRQETAEVVRLVPRTRAVGRRANGGGANFTSYGGGWCEESVDVPVPPIHATEALQLQSQEKFFDTFSGKVHELRMQLDELFREE